MLLKVGVFAYIQLSATSSRIPVIEFSSRGFQFIWLKIRLTWFHCSFSVIRLSPTSNNLLNFYLLYWYTELFTSVGTGHQITNLCDLIVHRNDWPLRSSDPLIMSKTLRFPLNSTTSANWSKSLRPSPNNLATEHGETTWLNAIFHQRESLEYDEQDPLLSFLIMRRHNAKHDLLQTGGRMIS